VLGVTSTSSLLQLLSLGSVAVVTITLPENSAVTNYGTLVTQSTNVTFLYGKHLVSKKLQFLDM
jgi:hypothetical protein